MYRLRGYRSNREVQAEEDKILIMLNQKKMFEPEEDLSQDNGESGDMKPGEEQDSSVSRWRNDKGQQENLLRNNLRTLFKDEDDINQVVVLIAQSDRPKINERFGEITKRLRNKKDKMTPMYFKLYVDDFLRGQNFGIPD